MARSTPWGAAQHVDKIARGISCVSTAGHGGMMVSKSLGDKILSVAAKKNAIDHAGYYCFEEDCDILVSMYELLPHYKSELEAVFTRFQNLSIEDCRASLIESLSWHHVNYLKEIKVTPSAYPLAVHEAELSHAKDVNDKTPGVLLYPDWDQVLVDVVAMNSCDGKIHYITRESYEKMQHDKLLYTRRWLSDCVEVDAKDLPPVSERLYFYMQASAAMYEKKLSVDPQLSELRETNPSYGSRHLFVGTLRTYVEKYKKLLEQNGVGAETIAQHTQAQLKKLKDNISSEFFAHSRSGFLEWPDAA